MIKNNRYFWSHLKTRSVTLQVSPKAARKQTGVLFRVGSIIDTGKGAGRKVTLEHLDYPNAQRIKNKGGKDVAVPFRMGETEFIYTSLHHAQLRNINTLLCALYKKGEVEKIVPEVISPGDILVFIQDAGSTKIKAVEALRVVEQHLQKPKTDRALVC